jgi:hypothetical protein
LSAGILELAKEVQPILAAYQSDKQKSLIVHHYLPSAQDHRKSMNSVQLPVFVEKSMEMLAVEWLVVEMIAAE